MWAQFLDTCQQWHQYTGTHMQLTSFSRHYSTSFRRPSTWHRKKSLYSTNNGFKRDTRKAYVDCSEASKTSELAWERPYPQIPMQQRMDQRLILASWHQIAVCYQATSSSCHPTAGQHEERSSSRLHAHDTRCPSSLGRTTHVGAVPRHLSPLAPVQGRTCS